MNKVLDLAKQLKQSSGSSKAIEQSSGPMILTASKGFAVSVFVDVLLEYSSERIMKLCVNLGSGLYYMMENEDDCRLITYWNKMAKNNMAAAKLNSTELINCFPAHRGDISNIAPGGKIYLCLSNDYYATDTFYTIFRFRQ